MRNWQDLMQYVNDELSVAESSVIETSLPSVSYWLNLANEAFKKLGGLEHMTFTPSGATNVKEILKPISCDVVDEIFFKDNVVVKADADNYMLVADLAYCLSDNKILFNAPISFQSGDIVLYGSGVFSDMVRDPAAMNTPFDILGARYHEAIAHYMLFRHFAVKPTREAQVLAGNYKTMFDEAKLRYIWSLRKARSEYAKFFEVDGIQHKPFSVTNLTYNYISDVDAYSREETDTLIENTLNTARGFANTAQRVAEGYTDELVGDINNVLDEVNGEDTE